MNGDSDDIKKKLDWGQNGVGDRFARKIFNYTSIYKNRETKCYSENSDDIIDPSILKNFITTTRNDGTGIIGLFIHSIRDNTSPHPIRKSIGDEVRKRSCVVCGKGPTKRDTVCDHKNDLYNDIRVLNIDTQNIDDFQALCTHCNLQKRQVNKNELKNGILFSAKNLPQFDHFDFEFVWEKRNLDLQDINCKVGTFWYDPIQFQKNLFSYVIENRIQIPLQKPY